jgi:MFS family permease
MATGIGIFLIAAAMPSLTVAGNLPLLLLISGVMGFAQALIIPCTTALVAEQIPDQHLGAGLGLVGTLDNGGKVIGPVVGGLLIASFGYGGMLWALGGFLLLCGLLVLAFALRRFSRDLDPNLPLESGGD